MLNKYGHPDFTNVVQNLGMVLISLLYGECNMRKTINIALKCGFDTDCTCASAASIIGIIKGYKALGELGELIKDYFVCGIDVVRPSDSIYDLAKDTAKLAINMPKNPEIEPEYYSDEGMNKALECLTPIKWNVYGPYFDQLDLPMNPDYPSPHGEGCVLPDIVCMVNNEAFLERDYEKGDKACTIESYEDFIEIDKYITMEGQYACFLETTIVSPADKKVWAVIGNNDGFVLSVNDEQVIKKDEIRLWTPYNNFCFVDFISLKNVKIELKEAGIREIRIKNNETQQQLADLLETTQQAYLKYEKGINEMPIRRIIKLCKHYNLSADYILGLTDQPKSLK